MEAVRGRRGERSGAERACDGSAAASDSLGGGGTVGAFMNSYVRVHARGSRTFRRAARLFLRRTTRRTWIRRRC